MKFEKSMVWNIENKEQYWINCCAEKIIGHDFFYYDILFFTKDRAIEFIKMILFKYKEEVQETLYNVFEPNKDDIKKILDELQGSAWSKSESRFVESMPAEITITDNSVFLRRHVEIRRGACLKTKKSVIIDGLEYSREANEIRWSSWYPAGIEEICLSIYEKENIIVS